MADHITNFRVLRTIFLVNQDGQLRQVLNVQMDNSGDTAASHLEAAMAGQTFALSLPAITRGRRLYPITIPEVTRTTPARFTLKVGDAELVYETTIEPVRHWRVYLVHFSHHDLGYTDLPDVCINQHRDYLDRIIQYCRQTDDLPEEARFRWTCDTTWALKYYLSQRPSKVIEQLFDLVRDGRIEITAQFAAFNSAMLDHEELVRSIYYAHELARQHGFTIKSAMTTDIPGAPWGFPQVLAKSGVRYLATAVNQQYAQGGLPYARVPRICRPFYWGSPDGSEVLVWNSDPEHIYIEGLNLGMTQDYELVRNHLPAYLTALEGDGYPFDAIHLRTTFKGCDNAPPCPYLPRIVCEWNQRWAYPKLIISTSAPFFEYMEKTYGDQFPHYNGDWTDWWINGPGSSAHETGLNRVTHGRLATAETLATLRAQVDNSFAYPAEVIKETYDDMMLYDEHTWGMWCTASDPYKPITAQHWQVKANFAHDAARATDRLLDEGLDGLGHLIATGTHRAIAIFNPLSWPRTAPVQIILPREVVSSIGPFSLHSDKGEVVPYQVVESHHGGSLTLALLAEDVPAMGYRTYSLVPSEPARENAGQVHVDGHCIENRYYRLVLDPRTGGITSIYDKELGIELVDANSPYRLNQYVYDSGEPPTNGRFSPESADIHPGSHGAIWSSLVAVTKCRTFRDLRPSDPAAKGRSSTYATPWIRQEVILYDRLKRIDIVNRLYKEETLDKEGAYYAFPFSVPQGRFRVEIAGAAMAPGLDQLPDSCHDWHAVNSWLDISNANYGLTWSSREVPVVSIGDINTGKWQTSLDLNNSTFFAYLMNNYWDVNFKERQGGDFVFRFALTSHGPDWDDTKSTHFGRSFCTALQPILLPARQVGSLPAHGYSFCQIDKPNVVILAYKRAEDGDGYIVRLLELLGEQTTIRLHLPGLRMASAHRASIVEQDIEPLDISGNDVSVVVPPFGIETLRFRIEQGLTPCKS